MLSKFKGLIGYTDEDFNELWGNATFVLDTNVLLKLYKYQSKDLSENLLKILKELKEENRLWIPYQVAIEYFHNYKNHIGMQIKGHQELEKKLKEGTESLKSSLDQIGNKHPYINVDKFKFYTEEFEKLNNKLNETIKKEIKGIIDTEQLSKDILELFDGIIGESYDQEEINEIEKQGETRYVQKLPPGFKDQGGNKKDIVRRYGGLNYSLKYGDLIVWKQIIKEATKNSKPIIFITEDNKSDWWSSEEGKSLGPDTRLIQEFINETDQNFYMYTIDKFVEYGKEHLNIDVTENEFNEIIKSLNKLKKSESVPVSNDIGFENLLDFINKTNEYNEQPLRYLNSLINKYENKNKDYAKRLKMSGFTLAQVFDYLSPTQKRLAKLRFDLAELDNEDNKTGYNNAISWIFEQALDNMKKAASELLDKLLNIDSKSAESILIELQHLPDDHVEQGIEILEIIKYMKRYLKNNDFFL